MLVLAGCKVNYSFTGASIAPDVKTVSIKYFQNNAPLAHPTLAQSLTEALKDIFSSQTNLTLLNRNADLNFEGTIVNYYTSPVAIQGNDQAALTRLTISVNIKFVNIKDEKQNYETTFSRDMTFSSRVTLSSVELDLIRDINRQLVQDIFNRSVSNW
jgi:hypothetical protein